MPRAYWTGNVQISLVSFGVNLFVATESKSGISFHQISRRTGERIRHQKVLESAAESKEATTGVEADDVVKGYEYSKGRYVAIEPSELENLRVPSKHVIAVSQFVGRDELRPEYVEKPYYVVPENDLQMEAFGVVRKALLDTGKAAIGKIAFSGREHVMALAPAADGGMVAYTLRYPNELRDEKEYFKDIKEPTVDQDSLQLAEALIKKMSAKLDLSKFEDGYEVAVKALVEAKINNRPIPIDEAPKRPSNVVNLMDALRKSVGADARAAKKPVKNEKPGAAAKPAAKSNGKQAAKRKSA
jgi:DNA end-binding protein Ku